MRNILAALQIIPFMVVCTTGRCDPPLPNAQADSNDSPSADHRKHKGKEILGPGFGKYIFIAGGEFTMGCNSGEQDDEKPEHDVELSSFFVGRTPVTNAQFVVFLNETHTKREDYLCSQVHWANDITLADGKWVCEAGTEDVAASTESWILSERYCEWLSKKTGRKCRLPTEAEWEYVCRGKEGRKFPWRNDAKGVESKAWYWHGSKKAKKVRVGSFPEGATPEGVCDLLGYMDEVCSDWYDPEYYAKSPKTNPKGPSEAVPQYKNVKVTRGGFHRYYNSKSLVLRFFRDSQFFGVLPNTYLPRGWSRGKTVPPEVPQFVNGRIGLRVVVEDEKDRSN